MNEGRGAFLRVGLLVLGGLGLVIGLVWFFGGSNFSHGTAYESYFRESVQGLEVGAPVKYRGVTVGRVTELGLVTAEYGGSSTPEELDLQTYRLVFVRFLVDHRRLGQVPEADVAVKIGLRVRLASQGLTGLTYLELDFVDPTQYPAQEVPWTPKDQYIPSMPSTLLQVQEAATQFLAKLNRLDIDALSRSLTALVADLRTDLDSGDLHLALARSAVLLRTLNDSVTAADLPGLTADLRRTSDALRELAQDRDLHRTLVNAAVASDHLAEASARLGPLIAALQATSQRIDSGTGDLQQGLLPILRDAQAAAANLRQTSDELRRYPPQILLAAPPPRSREPAN
jgi:phospholipid/cholesterol/gamma-HCH transport system substrate-binding protein